MQQNESALLAAGCNLFPRFGLKAYVFLGGEVAEDVDRPQMPNKQNPGIDWAGCVLAY